VLTAHLPWKVQDLACSVLGKLPLLIKSLRSFCHAWNFPSKMFDELVQGRIWLCAPGFKSVVYGEICVRILYIHGSFQLLVQGSFACEIPGNTK